MTTLRPLPVALLLLLSYLPLGYAGTLTVSRDALERTLKQQLFNGTGGSTNSLYYLKGDPQSACSITAEEPKLSFEQDRIVVRMKTHARLGRAVGGACVGMAFNFPAQVSFTPDAEGETIGFRDARLDKISDNKEVNFVLAPFLRRQVPSGMKVNAATLLRKALAGSTASSGYKVTLDRLKIHSIVVQGDALVVDVDGDLSVQ
jgi:hypothetical protein